MKNRSKFLRHVLWVFLLLGNAVVGVFAAEAGADDAREILNASPHDSWRAIGVAASAALAVGVSVLGASHAVGRIGSAALGAATEKPELLTRSLLYVALAEGLAVLGFAIGMMLVQKI